MRSASDKIQGRKRLLAWLLAVTLVVTLLPTLGGSVKAAPEGYTWTEFLVVDPDGTASGRTCTLEDMKTKLGITEATADIKIGNITSSNANILPVPTVSANAISVTLKPGAVGTYTLTVPVLKAADDTLLQTLTIQAVIKDYKDFVTIGSASSKVVYGTKLKDAKLPAGSYNVGNYGYAKTVSTEWASDTKKDYKLSETLDLKWTVKTRTSGDKTDKVKVAADTVYQKASPVSNVNPQPIYVKYDPKKNIKTVAADALKISEPTWTTGSGDTRKATGTWQFEDETEIPSAAKQQYKMKFVYKTPDLDNCNDVSPKIVYIYVDKVPAKVSKAPIVPEITVGQPLSSVKITGEADDGVTGTFYWENESIVPTIKDSNTTDYNWYFDPDPQYAVNYTRTTGKTKIKVRKITDAPLRDKMVAKSEWSVGKATKYVHEVGLPKNWKWKDEDAKKEIKKSGDKVTATAEYIGEDKENYENLTQLIVLARDKKCNHDVVQYGYPGTSSYGSDRRNATCDKSGYQGTKYCKMCGAVIGIGEELEPHGHVYGSSVIQTATATRYGIRRYKCIYCTANYDEYFLYSSHNNAGVITLKPALYNNITTASVVLSYDDVLTAIGESPSKTITVEVMPMSGDAPKEADRVNVVLTKEVQQLLAVQGASKLTLSMMGVQVDLDATALLALKDKNYGEVSISVSDMEIKEGRPSYAISLQKLDTTKEEEAPIEDFESTGITLRIPYDRQMVDSNGKVTVNGTLEDITKIQGYYVTTDDKIAYVSGSVYNATTSELEIPIKKFARYGVGYKTASTGGATKVIKIRAIAKKTYIALKWNKVKGATKYVVYGGKADGTLSEIATVTKLGYMHKKLSRKTAYCYYIEAVTSSKTIKSKKIYVYTIGGKYGNQYELTVTPPELNLVASQKQVLKVTYKKTGKLKPFAAYVRYQSSNTAVAKVSSKGRVTAVGKGTCYIYIFALNGYKKSVKVTVTE